MLDTDRNSELWVRLWSNANVCSTTSTQSRLTFAVWKPKLVETQCFFVFFCTLRGVGVQMVEPLYQSPSFDGVLPSLVFLQVPYVCRLMSVYVLCIYLSIYLYDYFFMILYFDVVSNVTPCRTFHLLLWAMCSGPVLENASWICVLLQEGRPATSPCSWQTRYSVEIVVQMCFQFNCYYLT